MERRLSGPDKDWLDARESAAFLSLSRSTFLSLVKAGWVPEGVPMSEGVVRWYWLDLVAYAHLRSRGWDPAGDKNLPRGASADDREEPD